MKRGDVVRLRHGKDEFDATVVLISGLMLYLKFTGRLAEHVDGVALIREDGRWMTVTTDREVTVLP